MNFILDIYGELIAHSQKLDAKVNFMGSVEGMPKTLLGTVN